MNAQEIDRFGRLGQETEVLENAIILACSTTRNNDSLNLRRCKMSFTYLIDALAIGILTEPGIVVIAACSPATLLPCLFGGYSKSSL